MPDDAEPARLIVLSVDGMHPNFCRRPSEFGVKLPSIQALAAAGASAEAMESVYPSTTYPAHATLMTGVPPRVHGICSHLASLDPTESARPWHWFAQAIRVPALWSLARAQGLRSAAVSWPVSVGAPIDLNVPEIWDPHVPDPRKDFTTVTQYATPGLFEELAQVLRLSTEMADPDQLRGEAALYLWEKYRPDLLLVHFVGYDQQAHRCGPRSPEALAALERVDVEVGRLRDAASHDHSVTFVVLSDHGFLPVEKDVAPLTILAEEGLFGSTGEGQRELLKLGAVHAGGSFAVFWLETPTAREEVALARALERLTETGGVAEVVDRGRLGSLGSDPEAEWMLDAAQGFYFSDRFEGPTLKEGAGDRGTHGHLPTRRGMEASFIIAGPGVAPGTNLGRIRLTDVAPTLAVRLGVAPGLLASDAGPLNLG
ncbi:MAG: alkaline phosphatase family protein [Acidobacteriia bacterium]|nr:alkaline phosphatase family protein [Terriglobia bacterium]